MTSNSTQCAATYPQCHWQGDLGTATRAGKRTARKTGPQMQPGASGTECRRPEAAMRSAAVVSNKKTREIRAHVRVTCASEASNAGCRGMHSTVSDAMSTSCNDNSERKAWPWQRDSRSGGRPEATLLGAVGMKAAAPTHGGKALGLASGRARRRCDGQLRMLLPRSS